MNIPAHGVRLMSNPRDLTARLCQRDLMLATPGKLFSPGWIYELKYDLYRCLSWNQVWPMDFTRSRLAGIAAGICRPEGAKGHR